MMHYKYLRIQGQELAENTMYAKGIFSMCWQLIQDDVMDEEDAALYREIDDWFADNLPWPPQCKNQEKVVCFFKTENSDEMMKMIRPALWLLERYDHPYYLVYTNTPGEIVYAHQFDPGLRAVLLADARSVRLLAHGGHDRTQRLFHLRTGCAGRVLPGPDLLLRPLRTQSKKAGSLYDPAFMRQSAVQQMSNDLL